VAANLAIALAQLRSRVVLIDLDAGAPALHRLFGVPERAAGLEALLGAEVDTIEEALTSTSVRNLRLLSARGVAAGAPLPLGAEEQHRLLERIWELDADVVIADVGAGGAANDLSDLEAAGALALVVCAPDPPSIRSAYGLFRRAVIRGIEHVAGGTPEGAALVAGVAGPTAPPMRELLDLASARPNLREAIAGSLSAFCGRLVGNLTRGPEEVDTLYAVSRLIQEFLGITVPVLGVVRASAEVQAGSAGKPLLLGSGIDRNVTEFHTMAEQLLVDEPEVEMARCRAAPLPVAGAPELPETGEEAALPAPLAAYMRRHPRHPVDWIARFRSDGGRSTAVRVFEVSAVGASIQTLPGLDAGDRGELTFSQLAGQPSVRVTVSDVRPRLGRAGLQIDGPAETAMSIAAIAAAL
jgi:MinD-like ATPase involved in chromosome partitioning or flagellar assembly